MIFYVSVVVFSMTFFVKKFKNTAQRVLHNVHQLGYVPQVSNCRLSPLPHKPSIAGSADWTLSWQSRDVAAGAIAHVSWTTTKLIPEALKQHLHVLEDPGMIKLLGRAKFMELVIFGNVGWQERVRKFIALKNKSCIYHKMTSIWAST